MKIYERNITKRNNQFYAFSVKQISLQVKTIVQKPHLKLQLGVMKKTIKQKNKDN